MTDKTGEIASDSLRNKDRQKDIKKLVHKAIRRVWPTRNVNYVLLAYDPSDGELSFTAHGDQEKFKQALQIGIQLLEAREREAGPQIVQPTAAELAQLRANGQRPH